MLCGLAMMASCSDKTTDVESRVDALYDKMTKEERIMQLQSGFMDQLFDEDGKLDTAKCDSLIPNGIGHFSQYASQQPLDPEVLRDRVMAVQNWLINNTPSGIPALFHEEVLSGINTLGSTIYPQQIGQACSFDPELAELKTRQTSTALRKMGSAVAVADGGRVPESEFQPSGGVIWRGWLPVGRDGHGFRERSATGRP